MISFLTVCRNDSWRIEEWVKFHHKLGVSHFLIYDDRSTDDTWEVLLRLSKTYPITPLKTDGIGSYSRVHCPNVYLHINDVSQRILRHTLYGLQRLRSEGFHWCGVFELDEFVCPVLPDEAREGFFTEYFRDKDDLPKIFVHSYDMQAPFSVGDLVTKKTVRCWSQETKRYALGSKYAARVKCFINLKLWDGICNFIHYINDSPFFNEGESQMTAESRMKTHKPWSVWSKMIGSDNRIRICHYRNDSEIPVYNDGFANAAAILK